MPNKLPRRVQNLRLAKHPTPCCQSVWIVKQSIKPAKGRRKQSTVCLSCKQRVTGKYASTAQKL